MIDEDTFFDPAFTPHTHQTLLFSISWMFLQPYKHQNCRIFSSEATIPCENYCFSWRGSDCSWPIRRKFRQYPYVISKFSMCGLTFLVPSLLSMPLAQWPAVRCVRGGRGFWHSQLFSPPNRTRTRAVSSCASACRLHLFKKISFGTIFIAYCIWLPLQKRLVSYSKPYKLKVTITDNNIYQNPSTKTDVNFIFDCHISLSLSLSQIR